MSAVHYIFRGQPSYTIFNKSFDNPDDVLFQQLNEIDPYFLAEEQLQNTSSALQDRIVDPRTNKELQYSTYNYSEPGKNCSVFNGDGIRSTLTKTQQEACLRVLLGWQDKTEIEEIDLIIWRQQEGKIKREREHMRQFIRDYADKHKEVMYAPTKRLNEYYRHWYKRKANTLLSQHTENVAFNTRNGLPHVSVCKGISDDRAEISDVQLLERSGWIRVLSAGKEIEWQNLNFRLETYAENFKNATDKLVENVFERKLAAELMDFGEQESSRNCYLPFETILFLLSAGDYVDLPTECLLEISSAPLQDHKIIKFDNPFPARNCGWHTQQQVVEQAFAVFNSMKGRSKWLRVENGTLEPEILKTPEIHAVNESVSIYKPITIENVFEKYKCLEVPTEQLVKSNKALIKWHLKKVDSADDLKILTTLCLPPVLNEQAKEFLAFETLKLEYKSQFGCELLTKYELLRAWLQMHLVPQAVNYGLCYRLSSIDCDIQLKETMSLHTIENHLKQHYHVNPEQLISNLAEFLKLLYNMPAGKYLMRYNPKYRDQLLLCAPSTEITQNTVYLHSLLQAEPTDMAFMTQLQYLPIVETLCSRVHLKYRILPCAFLPQLRHQKNLQTPATRAKVMKMALQKRQDAAAKLQLNKTKADETKRRKHKRWRQAKRKKAAKEKLLQEEAESKKLLEF